MMDRKFVLGLIIGAAIGSVTGLMYTPRPGAETREQLMERSKAAADRLGRAAAAVAGGQSEAGEEVKQAM